MKGHRGGKLSDACSAPVGMFGEPFSHKNKKGFFKCVVFLLYM